MSKKTAEPTSTTDLFAEKLSALSALIGGDKAALTALATTFGLPADEKELVQAHQAGDLALRRAMAAELAKLQPGIASRLWLSNYLVLSRTDESVLEEREAAEASAIRSIRDSNRARVTGMQMPGRVVGQNRNEFDESMDIVVEARAMVRELRRLTGWNAHTLHAVYVALHTLEDGHFEALKRLGELE